MWLSCQTQQEIADKEGMSQPAVVALLSEFPDLEKLIKPAKAAAEHATELVGSAEAGIPASEFRPKLPNIVGHQWTQRQVLDWERIFPMSGPSINYWSFANARPTLMLSV